MIVKHQVYICLHLFGNKSYWYKCPEMHPVFEKLYKWYNYQF